MLRVQLGKDQLPLRWLLGELNSKGLGAWLLARVARGILSGFLQSVRAGKLQATCFVAANLFLDTPSALVHSVLEKQVVNSSPYSEGDSDTGQWLSRRRIPRGPIGRLPTTVTVKQPQQNDSNKDLKKEAYNI